MSNWPLERNNSVYIENLDTKAQYKCISIPIKVSSYGNSKKNKYTYTCVAFWWQLVDSYDSYLQLLFPQSVFGGLQ